MGRKRKLPPKNERKNEENFEESRRVLKVPVVIKPVVVPVPSVVVPIEVTDVEVVVRGVAVPCDMPSITPPFEILSNDLRIESYMAS